MKPSELLSVVSDNTYLLLEAKDANYLASFGINFLPFHMIQGTTKLINWRPLVIFIIIPPMKPRELLSIV